MQNVASLEKSQLLNICLGVTYHSCRWRKQNTQLFFTLLLICSQLPNRIKFYIMVNSFPGVSRHSRIYFVYNLRLPNTKSKFTTLRDFKNYYHDLFIADRIRVNKLHDRDSKV